VLLRFLRLVVINRHFALDFSKSGYLKPLRCSHEQHVMVSHFLVLTRRRKMPLHFTFVSVQHRTSIQFSSLLPFYNRHFSSTSCTCLTYGGSLTAGSLHRLVHPVTENAQVRVLPEYVGSTVVCCLHAGGMFVNRLWFTAE